MADASSYALPSGTLAGPLVAGCDLTATEREKYRRIWSHDAYRRVSPGMMEVDRAWAACGMRPGQRLIDYGAGPARATAEFAARGLTVLAVDIADNARETTVPYFEACLWSLPADLRPVEYGYCCDVMEHIPPGKVSAVLDGIARRTLVAAYFRIATRPDVMGRRLIGEPLHLTIRDGRWWRDRLADHFGDVEVVADTGRDVMIVARPELG